MELNLHSNKLGIARPYDLIRLRSVVFVLRAKSMLVNQCVGRWTARRVMIGMNYRGLRTLIFSAETSLRVPTAMIFVPSKDGISHNPNEYTSEEEWYYPALCELTNFQRGRCASPP